MDITFTGKRILVTGAGRGIGKEITRQLVKCGAEVIALGKTKKSLESLREEISNVQVIPVDLEDWDKTRNALQNVEHVDALVNNAAFVPHAPFLEVKPEEFDKTFSVNVKAVINISQIIAKRWVANKTAGTIVNLSSQASLSAFHGHTVYGGSKGALDSISRTMALELGPHNIRVNCINPVVIKTERAQLKWSDPVVAQAFLSKIPLGRFGEINEVVDVVLYLLSNKSSMISGVTLPVNGGYSPIL